jgi:hypothetical protein
MLIVTKEGITMSVTAPIGHNLRVDLHTALDPETIDAWLTEQFAARQARAASLLASYKKFLFATASGIQADDIAAKATDFAKMLKIEVKEIDQTRMAIKEPVLAATRQIDGMGRKLSEPLVAAMTEVERRITTFLRAKEQEVRRIAAEEAARKEAEAQTLLDQACADGENAIDGESIAAAADLMEEVQAAEAIAEAPAKELTRVRTQLGTTTALRDNWIYAVDDLGKVPAAYLQINDAVVKAAIKSGTRAIPGLIITNEPKASVR